MNRRNLLRTIGGIATTTSVAALAGCVSNNDDGDGDSGGEAGSGDGPGDEHTNHIGLRFNMTESFVDQAEYDNVELVTLEDDDSDDRAMELRYELEVFPENDNDDCVETEVEITVLDRNDAVIEENEHYGDTFDEGETYLVEHVIPVDPEDVGSLEVLLGTNDLGSQCHF